VGELSAQLYGAADPAKTVAFASMVSGIAAAVAGQDAQGVSIAASTGANAAQNNWLNHADKAQLDQLKQKRLAGQCDGACEQRIAGLELLDKLNNRALLNACVNGTQAECQTQVERDPAAYKYGVDNLGKILLGRPIAQAGNNANKALASLSQALEKTQLTPLVNAQGVITGWAVDLGGADPDTLRYWLGAGVYVGAGVILPTSAIDLIPGAGKGLKVITRGTERVVVEEASGKVLGRLTENRTRGVAFQSDALTARGIDENTLRITVTLPDGKPVTVIPDALGRTIIEVKDVKNLSNSNQFRGYLQASIDQGKPIELIVSPRTESISGPLKNLIRVDSGGSIKVFDPATKTFSPYLGR
jgi:hypothetical protein